MEFTVSKADLVRELSLSQGVVEKKTTIPILSNVLVEAKKTGSHLRPPIWSWASAALVQRKLKKQGSGTIPARKLLDYVRLLPDADLTVKFLENHWASLVCGRSRTRIAGMSRESFPELPTMPETIAEIPVKLLASMISRTSFAISLEESRFTLNGALLLLKSGCATMVATDGHRLAYVEQLRRNGPASPASFARWCQEGHGARLLKLADESRRRQQAAFSPATRTICSFSLASGC